MVLRACTLSREYQQPVDSNFSMKVILFLSVMYQLCHELAGSSKRSESLHRSMEGDSSESMLCSQECDRRRDDTMLC